MLIDLATLGRSELNRLIVGLVGPRPIAWISTLAEDGTRNLAPFSFFNAFSFNPPVLAVGPGSRVGIEKDSLRNIRATGEFTVSVVTEELAEHANRSSGDFPAEVDEWEVAGVHPAASSDVNPAYVAESPAAFECRVKQIVDLGTPEQPTNALVIGLVTRIHVDDDVLEDFEPQPDRLRLVGRMGGSLWCTTRDRFALPRPRADELGDLLAGRRSEPSMLTGELLRTALVANDYDPFAPAQAADPYPQYARARRNCPIFYSPVMRAWMVTRYDDIVNITKDPTRFSSLESNRSTDEIPAEVSEILALGFTNVPGLVNNDPPRHTRLRRLANQAFTPRRVTEQEERIREIADELIDSFVADGHADIISAFATPFPMLVICEILGVAGRDIEKIRRWAEDYRTAEQPALSPEERIRCAHSTVALQLYLGALVEDRRGLPRDDLISALIAADTDGETLSTAEIVSVTFQLLFGGHETTSGLIGIMLLQLARQPEQWAALREDPGLAERAVEEALRRESPVQGLMRTATEDVEIGGVTIPKGARLQLLFASANHDVDESACPERFDIHRADDAHKHMAFGRGIHFCIGAPLARAEARIALEQISLRLPGLRLAGADPYEYAPSTLFHGLRSLQLEW